MKYSESVQLGLLMLTPDFSEHSLLTDLHVNVAEKALAGKK